MYGGLYLDSLSGASYLAQSLFIPCQVTPNSRTYHLMWDWLMKSADGSGSRDWLGIIT